MTPLHHNLNSFKWNRATSWTKSQKNVSSEKRQHWTAASTLKPSKACTKLGNSFLAGIYIGGSKTEKNRIPEDFFFSCVFRTKFLQESGFGGGRRNSCFWPLSQDFFAGIPVGQNSCIYSGFLVIPRNSSGFLWIPVPAKRCGSGQPTKSPPTSSPPASSPHRSVLHNAPASQSCCIFSATPCHDNDDNDNGNGNDYSGNNNDIGGSNSDGGGSRQQSTNKINKLNK